MVQRLRSVAGSTAVCCDGGAITCNSLLLRAAHEHEQRTYWSLVRPLLSPLKSRAYMRLIFDWSARMGRRACDEHVTSFRVRKDRACSDPGGDIPKARVQPA